MGLRWSAVRGCAWVQCGAAYALCMGPRWGVVAAERAAGGGGGCSTDARSRAAPICGWRGLRKVCVGGIERGWGQGERDESGGGAAAAVLAGGAVVQGRGEGGGVWGAARQT